MLTGWSNFDDTLRALDMLQRHMDRVFEDWREPDAPQRTALPARRRAHAAWPPTNLLETKESFVVKAEVPGLAQSDVSVSVEDEALVIRGERKVDVPQGYKVHVRERLPYAFTRKLPLPARVEADAVTATLEHGVLTVTLPKAKETLPRQIAVKAG